MRSHREGSLVSPRWRVVIKAEEVLRGRLDEPITIAALSHTVGVSERTLRNAFVDVHRQSPKQYLLNQRLHAAREALSAADCKMTSVTAIATEHGFYELGRFALQYKARFGESPSDTLRGLGQCRPSLRPIAFTSPVGHENV